MAVLLQRFALKQPIFEKLDAIQKWRKGKKKRRRKEEDLPSEKDSFFF